MSNYVKATDFSAKDSLLTGDPLKIVSGTEIDDEFNAIQTAVNTKSNTNSPTFTGTPAAPTATAGTSTTQIATTSFVTTAINTASTTLTTAIQALFPVGSIYTNASVSTNPAILLGFGTWEAFGSGKVLVGVDSGDTSFDTLGETGGSKDAINVSHTHTATSVVTDPGHSHTFTSGADGFVGSASHTATNIYSNKSTTSSTTGISVATSLSTDGSDGTNANLQPYITVYMWKRTA